MSKKRTLQNLGQIKKSLRNPIGQFLKKLLLISFGKAKIRMADKI